MSAEPIILAADHRAGEMRTHFRERNPLMHEILTLNHPNNHQRRERYRNLSEGEHVRDEQQERPQRQPEDPSPNQDRRLRVTRRTAPIRNQATTATGPL